MREEACISNAKSSRRIEESNDQGFVPPKMTKTEKSKSFKISRSIENINLMFSISNDIHFWSRRIQVAEKECSKFEKLKFRKTSKMTQIKIYDS